MASFSGDSNNAPAATVCTDEPVAITKASPTISTQLNASSITVGGSDYDTAALAGFAPGGTGGTVTYTVYTDSGCTTGGQPAGTVDIDENTGASTSNPLTFNTVGTFYWQAVFNGDSDDMGYSQHLCQRSGNGWSVVAYDHLDGTPNEWGAGDEASGQRGPGRREQPRRQRVDHFQSVRAG